MRPGSSFRLIVEPGQWHPASVPLMVMVLARPHRRSPGYALISDDLDGRNWTSVRVDWETLVNWQLAERLQPPAAVTPLHGDGQVT